MPVVTQPNLIEQSDFLGGWSPDGDDATTTPDVLLDTLNLVPDRNTGSLRTREGIRQLIETKLVADTDHYVLQLFHFRATQALHYIIAVVTDGTATAGNVRLYAIDMTDLSSARIDDSGVTWANPTKQHWGVAIDKVWYGGSKGNAMYSWDPTTDTYDGDAGTGNWREWTSDVDDSMETDTEYARDHAWNGKERVLSGGDVYRPNKSIRYDTWEDDRYYSRGTKVSRKTTWDSTESYWKSFKCIDGHDSSDAAKEPGTGADTADFWEPIRLSKPFNEDGETNEHWDFVPIAAETSVAVWHADRLFMRFDGQGDGSRVQYSAPIKPDKGEDIPDVTWDPTDFAPSTDFDGAGGGWIPFNDGKTGGDIRALHSYNSYLLVFKRRSVWALAGTDDSTWVRKNVATEVGCVGPQAVTELDGLVYFLSDDGLYVTDGTTAEPVQGANRVRDYLRARMDESLALDDDRDPTVFSYQGFIFISLPDEADDEPHITIVYDPQTQGFWKLDLPVLTAVRFREDGITRLAVAPPPTYGTDPCTMVYEYTGDTDEDELGNVSDIEWTMRTAWLPFGTVREQRRIRRSWFIVAGTQTYTIEAYRDWVDSVVSTVDRLPTTTSAVHIEGEWFADSHAVSYRLSGLEAPARVHGYAVDTEPRRIRYHTG